ncbi:hypothetical protein JB92DRAFT_546189 [Gautieria morchelliformis]|nr:hypothetical protein JB92DRAFT_546189 [Gautieria morchelliformis]
MQGERTHIIAPSYLECILVPYLAMPTALSIQCLLYSTPTHHHRAHGRQLSSMFALFHQYHPTAFS